MCVWCMCVLLSSACTQEEGEDPSVIGAISDAVKRHPNLTEVTVSNKEFVSRSLFIGVVKGVLQKADVQKVDTKKNKDWPLDQGTLHDSCCDV